MSEAEADKSRKDAKRKKLRDVKIPLPVNPQRRLEAERDAELWLTTYFPEVFYEAFTEDRREMVSAIEHAAQYGGDQSIAGPRGEGKTTIALRTALRLMFCRKCDFPVVIGKSQGKSQLELKDIREQLQQSPILAEDYPEVCIPFRAVGAWSSKARMQTVAGIETNIVLACDHIAFPTIKRSQLPIDWPAEIEPASCGQVMYCLGMDGPIRGTKFRGKRPKLAIMDDIEDRQAASSDVLINKNEELIEKDIGGLGASAERVSRVMLCTLQNRKCNAYKYTLPPESKECTKPSWNGKRYRKMVKPPSRMDLVEQYIEMRRMRSNADPDGRLAHEFWLENLESIESDCIISNPNSFSKKVHPDGKPIEWSAIQAYYNRVADMGKDAVATEIDNDPPETVGPQGQGVTADLVASRLSGLARRQLPASTIALTAAIDLGKYRCHWIVIAWWTGGGGCVVDYGVAEVTGTDKALNNEASEPMIYKALLNWRDELLNKHYIDATGTNRRIDFCLVDSGTFTQAAYEFCRQSRGIFHPSKGINPYYPRKKSTDTCLASANLHAQKFTSEDIWLYELDTNHWKQWVHERFLTATMDENNMLRRGSLSLFELDGYEKHGSYAQHIAAEELLTEFKEGKGVKTYWNVKNENNHWFDATYMAAASSEVCGIKLIGGPEVSVEARQVDVDKSRPKQPTVRQHGSDRFRRRPGGWIPKRR